MTSVPSGSVISICMTEFSPHVVQTSPSTDAFFTNPPFRAAAQRPQTISYFALLVLLDVLDCLGYVVHPAEILRPLLAILMPVGVEIWAMRARCAGLLAASDHLLADLDAWPEIRELVPPLLEPCACQHEQTPKLGFIHLSDCVEHISVDRHASVPLVGEQARIRDPAISGHPSNGSNETTSMVLAQHHAVVPAFMSMYVVKERMSASMIVCEHCRGSSRAADTGNHYGRQTVGQGRGPTKDWIIRTRFQQTARRESVRCVWEYRTSFPQYRLVHPARRSRERPRHPRSQIAAVQDHGSPP
jgi:hypothetical protein